MKKLTMKDLRSWGPCYDPIRYLPENWKGTIKDILKHKDIPHADKLWAALRTDVTSEKVMCLFAVWSYRQTLKFIKDPDPRSVDAARVAERFAKGKATEEELRSARSAAESAARSAVWSAWSARSAAESAAEKSQIKKLIEMIEAESKQRKRKK